MVKHRQPLHPAICKAIGCDEGTPADEALAAWERCARSVCKPCWELKYCPYGPLVEDFPGVPATAHQMEAHVAKLVAMLAEDRWWNGHPMSDAQRKDIRRQIRAIKKDDYPESVPRSLVAALCNVWGHICPVFYVQSGATETRESRRQTRAISRDTMLKVVRRDGQICQACHKPVPDNEVEFDHVIPYSRGGPSNVENLRLVHRNCNRSKGASLQALLDERGTDAFFHPAHRKKPAKSKTARE